MRKYVYLIIIKEIWEKKSTLRHSIRSIYLNLKRSLFDEKKLKIYSGDTTKTRKTTTPHEMLDFNWSLSFDVLVSFKRVCITDGEYHNGCR